MNISTHHKISTVHFHPGDKRASLLCTPSTFILLDFFTFTFQLVCMVGVNFPQNINEHKRRSLKWSFILSRTTILSFALKCILDCNEGRCKKSIASSGKHVTVIRNESQVPLQLSGSHKSVLCQCHYNLTHEEFAINSFKVILISFVKIYFHENPSITVSVQCHW